jgi:Pin2-interacting protein X1
MPKLEDIKPTAAELSLPSSSSLPDVKPTAAELDVKPVREAEDMVSTSTLSVSDYFRQKMRAKAIARQIAAGETPDLEPEVPIASSSKLTSTWTGTRMAFEADNTPLSFSDAPVSQDALGVPLDEETARKAAKAARKAEKEAKKAAKAERKKAKGEGGVSEDGAKVKKRKREAE